MTTALLVVAAIIVTLCVAWAIFTAQRLNRLHIRTDAALQALRASLENRAWLIVAALPELEDVAREALAQPMQTSALDARAAAEARLERQLRSHLATHDAGTRQVRAIAEANVRVELARRFYNDAVTDTRALRTRLAVQAVRLGGTAKLPEYYEQVHELADVAE